MFMIHFTCEESLYRRRKTKSCVTRLMAVIYYKCINIYYYNTRVHNNIVLSPRRLSRFTAPGNTSNCSSRVVGIYHNTHTNTHTHACSDTSYSFRLLLLLLLLSLLFYGVKIYAFHRLPPPFADDNRDVAVDGFTQYRY